MQLRGRNIMFCNAQAATKESNDGDGSMRHEHGPVVDGEANNEMKPNGKVTTAAAAAMPAAMQPKSNEIFSSAADLVTNTKADDASELEAKEQYVAKADCPSTLRNAEQTNSPVLLSVSLPSESQPGTAMISPPTPLILRDDAVKDSTSYIPFSSGTPASRDDVGLYHLMNAACRKSAAAAPLHDDTSQLLSSDEMGKSMPMSTSNEEPGTKKPTASEISANQSLQVINQGSPAMNESSQTKADSASDPSKLAYQLSYEPTTSTTNPTLQSLSSFIPSNSSHERRGSGFLLMAAEAMERTESREKAIRHAAMQIAAASSETVDNAAAAAAHTMSSPSDYSARLQQVFEMPSLRADQLSTTSTRDYTQQQQQPIAWSMTAPLVEPKKSPPKSIAKPKSYDTDLLPSGRPRPPPQKHVYHDYASVYDPSMDADGNSQSRKKTGGVTQPFPDKLMAMLDQETIDHPEVVSWLPHGRAFLVRKPKVFTTDIMPIYFRQSKLTSFQRQLNLYGFRRITQGADGGAYYHELFLRYRPNLCARMTRQKVKGTGHKQPTDIATEPNFYTMSTVQPLPSASNSEYNAMPTTPIPSHQMFDDTSQEYNPLMNSPGIGAATLLKRLSSVGTPSNFSLDATTPPPLVAARRVGDFDFDPFQCETSMCTDTESFPNAMGKSEEKDQVERSAEV